MRITTKGQVTIPQAIRDHAGLLPHTEVEFEVRANGEVILKPVRRAVSKGRAAVARARGAANEPMVRGWTTDSILHLLRGDE
ncbi:MAG: AbrB/MazE/SpoVT family DNA-binding domain-containing protein [Burkholderiales bacterium]